MFGRASIFETGLSLSSRVWALLFVTRHISKLYYSMITSYSTLPISKYDEIVSIVDSSLSDFDKDTRIVSILSGIPVPELNQLPAYEVFSLISRSKFLSEPPKFLNLQSFTFQGFTFTPSFNLTYAQYMDAQSARSTPLLLHAILVPEGHSYNDGYQVDFSSLDSLSSLSILNSFIVGSIDSIQGSLQSSRRSLRLKRILSSRYRALDNLLRDLATLLSSPRLSR